MGLRSLFSYRISVRWSALHPERRVTSRPRGRRFAIPIATVAAVGALMLGGAPAVLASTGGSPTVTITVAVRSITVSPSTATFNTCSLSGTSTGSTLEFPNGLCTTGTSYITITNGAAAGHVDVNGADAIPADNGTHWTLCGSGSSSCLPGTDQFDEVGNFVTGSGT